MLDKILYQKQHFEVNMTTKISLLHTHTHRHTDTHTHPNTVLEQGCEESVRRGRALALESRGYHGHHIDW